MKGTLVGFGIVASILALSILTTKTTQNFCNEIEQCITKSNDYIKNENWIDSGIQIENAKRIYNDKESILRTFLNHEYLNDISCALSNLEAAINLKSIELFIPESNKLYATLNTISASDIPSIENIF